MIFEITPEFKKEQLTKDFYSLVQKSLQMSYYNVRLIRASLPCECVGVTHEYWSCGNNARGDKLTTLWIDDREDGGSKADKFERDVRLLTQGLEKEPDNVRYMFYLAQSYKCLKQYDEAIKWYSKRIENGGWKEEIWYAKLMIGEMHGLMDDWEKALSYYLDAYQFNPERAESLERIALYYRLKEQYDLAYLFATHGAKIPYPKNQQLFITDTVYTYRFDEELSIAAFYTPFKKEGLAAEDRLLRNSSVPSHVKKQALKNLHFYVENLPNVHFEQFPKETSLRTTPATGNPIIKIPVNQNTPTENPENDFSVFTIVAGPVPFENGYLAVAQHASCDENPYCFHRFLYLDKKQNIISMTDPFIYQHKGIEVCNDLNIDQKNASIQMSVTIENEEPKLASIDIKTIKSLLK